MSRPARETGSRPVACNYCKLKKIRCNGEHPCSNCQVRQENCDYPPVRQRRNRRTSIQNGRALEQRLAQLEELLRQSHSQENHSSGTQSQVFEPDDTITIGPPQHHDVPIQTHAADITEQPQFTDMMQTPSSNMYLQDAGFTNMSQIDQSSASLDDIFSVTPGPEISHSPFSFKNAISTLEYSFHVSPCLSPPKITTATLGVIAAPIISSSCHKIHKREFVRDRRSSIISPDNTDEPYRPGSLLSLCSASGIAWVAERTGTSDFADCAKMLTTDISGHRKSKAKAPFDRNPEPNEEDAWKFCRAYFEQTLESVFGIVHKPDFEDRLRAHFSDPDPDDDDPGWYALRNAVYASGCKAEYSKPCYSIRLEEAQDRSWKYFANSLSVQTELLYGQTDISAVQALIAMCYFTEGLRNPTLGYALCSNALLLAQAKGLHRQSSASSNDSQIPNRNWLFWSIYCYATHVACLSGRAPVIDDDTITCELPTVAAEGSTINIQIFTYTINLMRISSTIFKKLSAIKTLSQTPDEVIRVLSDLHWQIQGWKDTLPPNIRPDAPIDPTQLPPGYHLYHLIFLHYSYYGSLMAIHSLYAYPWNSSIIGSSEISSVSDQIATSSNIIIAASRNIILTTKYIDINASLPGWLLVYYPLVGFLNAFIHVLKHPTLSSTQLDIALMDMIVGHFGHLGFLSGSNMSFSFPRQIAMLASTTVKNAREEAERQSLSTTNNNEIYPRLFTDMRDTERPMFGVNDSNIMSAGY